MTTCTTPPRCNIGPPLPHCPLSHSFCCWRTLPALAKTEAALILAHRLMAAGQASGLYFALPTMATANQMYRRVGQVYRRLYAEHARPAIVLAHAARQLVEAFRLSQRPADAPYSPGEDTASLLCHSWLADSQKKSLLADVGVGSIDQALLAVLPARHQSLRQQGLADKILICDEIHAFDTYVLDHLKTLLEQHARLGGSAILLSATLPARLRAELTQAFARGRGMTPALAADARYPLITHVHTHRRPRLRHPPACGASGAGWRMCMSWMPCWR